MFFLLAAAALSGPVAGQGPEEAALAFLEDVKAEELPIGELLEGSALSPFCGERKRNRIAERLTRLRESLRRNAVVLSVAGQRMEGEYAGVLLAAKSEYNPLGVEVYAVGLKMTRGEWKAAPVLGGFENVDVGFDLGVERRLGELEKWMGRERTLLRGRLESGAEERFRRRIARAIPEKLLSSGEPREVVGAFLEACVAHDLPAVLAILGDHDGGADPGWDRLRSTVSRGLQGLDRSGAWRMLASPSVVRLVAAERRKGSSAEVAALFYVPNDPATPKLAWFRVSNHRGKWRVNLPDVFREADERALRLHASRWLEPDQVDDRFRKEFAKLFEASRKPLRRADAAGMGRLVETILQGDDLGEVFRCLHRHPEIDDGERKLAYAELAKLWASFQRGGEGSSRGMLVETLRQGEAGLLVFNEVSGVRLDRVQLTSVLLIKGEDGWGIAPGIVARGNFNRLGEKARKDQAVVFAQFVEQRGELERKAASRFLDRFSKATPAADREISADDARTLVDRFRRLLRRGQLLEAFDQCSLVDRGDGAWEALRALSYEYRGAKQASGPDRVLAVQREGPWAAVSLRAPSGAGDEPDYPMYLVVATDGGPRLVVDVGLRLVTNKGREILNDRTWERIDARMDKEEAGLVRRLFREHVSACTADRNGWLRNNKSSP